MAVKSALCSQLSKETATLRSGQHVADGQALQLDWWLLTWELSDCHVHQVCPRRAASHLNIWAVSREPPKPKLLTCLPLSILRKMEVDYRQKGPTSSFSGTTASVQPCSWTTGVMKMDLWAWPPWCVLLWLLWPLLPSHRVASSCTSEKRKCPNCTQFTSHCSSSVYYTELFY